MVGSIFDLVALRFLQWAVSLSIASNPFNSLTDSLELCSFKDKSYHDL